MITLRPSAARGHADHGWLDTFHTFSFADYYDPAHMSFRSLRVINEDRVAPGMGFGTHPHRDMEILTYILSGQLSHKDSMGHGRTITAGQLQAMSAGTGITHSEFNDSRSEPVHLLQIWIMPDRKGHTPRYAEWSPTPDADRISTLLASPDARENSAAIHQDALLYLLKIPASAETTHALAPGRAAWLQVMRGTVTLNSHVLSAGDGAAVEDETALTIRTQSGAEALLFDLA
jgi:redox-sensitive bicupin YhaK (pirin superfamily)